MHVLVGLVIIVASLWGARRFEGEALGGYGHIGTILLVVPMERRARRISASSTSRACARLKHPVNASRTLFSRTSRNN